MQPPVTRAPWGVPIVSAVAVVAGVLLAFAGGAAETEYLALDVAVAFSYPVVPKGAARIRVQLSAAHSAEDVEACVQAFVRSRAAVAG